MIGEVIHMWLTLTDRLTNLPMMWLSSVSSDCVCLVRMYLERSSHWQWNVFCSISINATLVNSRLFTVQNAVVCVVTGTRRFIILRQCCINFTGFWCISKSPSSWLWLPPSPLTVWRCPTWLTCASPFRQSSAGGSCDKLTAGHSSCHVSWPRSVGETLLCQARPHGTASPSNCRLHHCLPRRLQKTQKSFFDCWRRWRLWFKWHCINMRIHSFVQALSTANLWCCCHGDAVNADDAGLCCSSAKHSIVHSVWGSYHCTQRCLRCRISTHFGTMLIHCYSISTFLWALCLLCSIINFVSPWRQQ